MKQKYKVFLNDRIIEIGPSGKITKNKFTVTFPEDCQAEDVREWFKGFTESNAPKAFLLHPNPESFFAVFQSAFRVIHAAGGAVICNNNLLFIYRNGKWDLPKGKIDKNELAEDAALREVSEETGIVPGHIDRRLPPTFHIYRSPYPDSPGEWIFKNTYWFQMKCTNTRAGKPQLEEGITVVKWIDRKNLQEVLTNTYENLKQIIMLYRL